MSPAESKLDRRGLLFALAAYLMWGAFPFYFVAVNQAGPLEIIGHRIFFSFVFCLAGVLLWKEVADLRRVLADRRLFWQLAAAGVLVSVNWLIYVWAVLNDHIVDAALGYFINPLITVTLAVLVLHEKLRGLQWAAVGVGAAAVAVIAFGYGQVPWVALALAISFGLYGLVKKRVGTRVSPLVGLTVETGVLSPFAAGYLIWLLASGSAAFLAHGPALTFWLTMAGVVTAIPLLLFAAAASRIPLSTIGLIQYLTPFAQFAIGVWFNNEQMPPSRWLGFGFIWVALVLLTIDSLRSASVKDEPVQPKIQQ